MLDTTMKTQLKAYLEKLTKPVELIATLDDSAKSAEIKELLAEIAELSPKVTFKEDNSLNVRKPSFLITNPGSELGPRFAGSPLGHEFTSLVLALLWTGGHPSKEAQALLEQIRDIDGDFEFETYYSLSCHNCPDVVQALNLMSVLNPRIKHTAIDGGTFQNEITDRNVMGVPAVYLNGQEFGEGPYDADGNRRQSGYRCRKTCRRSAEQTRCLRRADCRFRPCGCGGGSVLRT